MGGTHCFLHLPHPWALRASPGHPRDRGRVKTEEKVLGWHHRVPGGKSLSVPWAGPWQPYSLVSTTLTWCLCRPLHALVTAISPLQGRDRRGAREGARRLQHSEVAQGGSRL